MRPNNWLCSRAKFLFHESVSDEQQRKRGCSWLQLVVAFGVVALLAFGAMPGRHRMQVKALQWAAAGNCRQIVAALRLYAEDHDGEYPDAHESEPSTSNDAFRILVREGILEDERVFGAKNSKFFPDNNIGEAPDFKEALEAGENHWAMTRGMTAKSISDLPLAFENPTTSGWPPSWNIDDAGKMVKGRAWRGGKVIVGFNDGSLDVIKLESDKGTNVPPARGSDGKDVFTRASPKMEILDIEE